MVTRHAPDVAPGRRPPAHHDEIPHPNVYEIDRQLHATTVERWVIIVGLVAFVAFWWFVVRVIPGLF